MKNYPYSYWRVVWKQFRHHQLGYLALIVILIFCLMGVYAPFLASSKPIIVHYDGAWYFPLFRYLFFSGFYTKRLDLFYNLLIFTLPLFILTAFVFRHHPFWRKISLLSIVAIHLILFAYFAFKTPSDPASDPALNHKKFTETQSILEAERLNPLLAQPLVPNWHTTLNYMTPYAKLNLILDYQQKKSQAQRLAPYANEYAQDMKKEGNKSTSMPILWNRLKENEQEDINHQKQIVEKYQAVYPEAKGMMTLLMERCQSSHTFSENKLPSTIVCEFLINLSEHEREKFIQASHTVNAYESALGQIKYIEDRNQWLETESSKISFELMPLVRPFHWEDDAGGSQDLNRHISWWELTRINRKDMVASLIFGIRISLTVGLSAVALALLIGIPIGALSGFYGGKVDMITYRLIEIWESMPTFFMLLMIVAFLQNKSIFIIVAVIGLFGWTNFSRFVRGEFFKQKQLPYVEACKALGFNDRYIIFSHLLPNAIPPLLTLVPFAVMGAITSEAGLSFLGLGEEGSCSWGVLMDEGRTAFPAESYLLWPPAALLTIFLVSIALVGDALRDALDPKLHRHA